MHICLTCGKDFPKPNKRVETTTVESSGMFPYQCIVDVYHTCPWCGSTHIEEAIHCERCGKPVGELDKYHLCHDCTVQAQQRFVDMLRENFTTGEIKLLNDTYEGEYFEI